MINGLFAASWRTGLSNLPTPVTKKSILDELEEKYGIDKLRNEQSMQYAIDTDEIFNRLYWDGHIKPVMLTRKQQKVLKKEEDGLIEGGDDGRGGDYAILESIAWRAVKKKLPRYI